MTLSLVKEYIAEKELLKDKQKVIVGVSGGADSIALVDMLHRLGYKCIVAHCNFHLRGEESNRDALFVEEFCVKNGLILETKDFDTIAYAQREGISIEMAARDLRYNWFEQLRVIHFTDKIAVAHHRDDSVETVLLNLIRGTGVKGLRGILPINDTIVRPLLCLSKEQIMEYITEKKLSYVNDSTNSENIYTRNKIRLNVIPLLETINPSVKEAIARTSEHLAQVESIYNLYIEQARENILKDEKINIPLLAQYYEPKAILYELLNPYGFSPATINQIFESLDAQSGKMFYSDTYQVLKDREYLIIQERGKLSIESFHIKEDDDNLFFPIALKIEKFTKDRTFSIEKNKNIIYIDKNLLKYPLTIRKWRSGDWFIPFGMKGKKKVSDYFTDQKFSLFEKEALWLLCSENDIVWIIGQRSDERYKVVFDTTEIIKITLIE